MLPNPQNAPTELPQGAVDPPVSVLVSQNLRLPELAVLHRDGSAIPTTVPKASVNEHRQMFSAKNEIWLAWKSLVTPPPTNTICSKQRD
jgi:hypothetical protein